ncbi:nuclear transport factor 2 family protein [Halorarum halophilum]|uniref:Nuclear transport factor 2 family protein n=1 Tax=Halorarum halophilum TaxID=2743090 RepID=A0A7D5K1T5_9EURY|nr:nuclear transport factor 2 family protein [Halobaculum halophilum]QLG28201.1 nuclear transport factor 2 family protein [Halobaculum halophilum]
MEEYRTMTEEERTDLVETYFRRLDAGEEFLDLFAADARVFYPKWGVATGTDEIGELFGDVGGTVTSMAHDYEYFNYVVDGDTVVVEGTSSGETADGVEWHPDGEPGGGRWCDVFEVREGAIRRLFIYLDPDYAGADTERYPWL